MFCFYIFFSIIDNNKDNGQALIIINNNLNMKM
jgi:hypothetical protein